MMSLKHALVATAALASAGLLSACATEDYVNQQVAAVNSKVDALGGRVDQNASQIQALNGSVQEANKNAQDAAARIAEHASTQTIANHVIGTDDTTKFETGSWRLTDDAKASLTAFAQKALADNQDVYFALEGHADSRGGTAYNHNLGLRRADAVRQFLYGQGIELHRMSAISMGETKPAAANDTAQGQAANRRVVIVTTGP